MSDSDKLLNEISTLANATRQALGDTRKTSHRHALDANLISGHSDEWQQHNDDTAIWQDGIDRLPDMISTARHRYNVPVSVLKNLVIGLRDFCEIADALK